MKRWLHASLLVGLLASAGCNGCGSKSGEVDDLSFTRCGQVDEPRERTLQAGSIKLVIQERTATLTSAGPLRIVAFTGPVDGPLSRTDMAELSAAAPGLVLLLGGLGATEELASANLGLLGTLRVPVLFVPGGLDRPSAFREAFGELEGDAAERLIDASGLRTLQAGKDRFVFVSGAPLGRYAVDDEACGFHQDDLDELRELGAGQGRSWLVSWAAPSGFGVTRGFGGLDAGSAELAGLAKEIGVKGGLFAYPEVQTAVPSSAAGALSLVVPRLGRTGSLREGRGFVPRSLSVLSLDATGLALATRP